MKNNKFFSLFLAGCMLSLTAGTHALANDSKEDTLIFKDGTILQGQILQINTDIVRIRMDDGAIVERNYHDITGISKEDTLLFKDGTMLKGQIVQINPDIVRIRTDDGNIIERNFNDLSGGAAEKDLREELARTEELSLRPLAKRHDWMIGPDLSYIRYEEPDFDVEEDGMMYGISGSYTYNGDPLSVTIEGRYSQGQVDYESPSGTLNHIDDYLYEARAFVGYDVKSSELAIVTRYYAGVGYRYLNDDSSGMWTDLGYYGYERESNYYYSPLGVKIFYKLPHDWSLVTTLEYDYFWEGKQKSHLGGETIKNNQDDGDGWRGSLQFRKDYQYLGFAVGPFVRYWHIDNSDMEYGGFEPENRSTEIGINVSMIF